MANFNPTTGKWVAEGGGEYNSRNDAMMRENMDNSGRGSGGGGVESAFLAALWRIFCLIPHFLGLIVGAVCALILKLGIVGKVLMTLLVSAFTLIFLALPANEWGWVHDPVMRNVAGIIEIAGAIAVGVWFWTRHHKVVRHIRYGDFVELATRCIVICFWGSIVLLLVDSIWKIGYGWSVSLIAPLAVAVVLWIVKADEYADYSAGSGSPESDPAPTFAPAERLAAGDLVWARWSGDGNLYFAGIAKTAGTGVHVVFYDGMEETVPAQDVFYLPEAMKSGLTPHGNWQYGGDFYPCEILATAPTSAHVRYTQDGVKEHLAYYAIAFMK